jgi:hypothetical protein
MLVHGIALINAGLPGKFGQDQSDGDGGGEAVLVGILMSKYDKSAVVQNASIIFLMILFFSWIVSMDFFGIGFHSRSP